VEILLQITSYPKTVAWFLSKITGYSFEVEHCTDSAVACTVTELAHV